MKDIIESESGAGPVPLFMRGRVWDRLAKSAFVSYLVLLTILLLMKSPETEELSGWWQSLESYAHLMSFFLLAVLAFVCRWPVPGRVIILGLIAYATLTELLQGAIGWRSPEWMDWFQDVAGIVLGAGLVVGMKKKWPGGQNGKNNMTGTSESG